jgi:hypothetical protein
MVCRSETSTLPLSEDEYLDLLSDLPEWKAEVVSLQAADKGVNRFAFVIHPLNIRQITKAIPLLRLFPNSVVAWLSSFKRPEAVGRVTGAVSKATGQVGGCGEQVDELSLSLAHLSVSVGVKYIVPMIFHKTSRIKLLMLENLNLLRL